MNAWSSFTRQATVLCLLIAVALAIVLMAVKYQVQRLEEELAELNRQIIAERQAVHVLRAEFSYLVEPERIRRLAVQHLGLVRIKPEQLGSFASLDAPSVDGGNALVARPLRTPAFSTSAAERAERGR